MATSYDLVFLSTWPVAFDGASPQQRPLGGSETALVELARRFAAQGLRVGVGCRLPVGGGGRHGGVDYHAHEVVEAALEGGEWDVGSLVVARDATRCQLGRRARRTFLWIQDMPMEGLRRQHREALPHIGRILAVSRFQRDRFVEVFGLPEERFLVTRNGVDASRYRPWVERCPTRLVYCSTPFRGLRVLLDAFPAIRAAVIEAELHVYTGMSLYDQADDPFEELYARARATPGVVFHGPVPQPALIAALRQAELLTYPATFNETSCIAAMMAMAAGAIPVVPPRAGLPETVGDCGLVVRGDARNDPGYAARYAEAVVGLLRDPDARATLRERCAARDLDWEPVVRAWWPLVAPDQR